MKTMFLAAAAVLAMSAGAAYAESEGDTAVGQEWAAENGTPRIPATVYFANRGAAAQQQQHSANVQQFPAQDGNG